MHKYIMLLTRKKYRDNFDKGIQKNKIEKLIFEKTRFILEKRTVKVLT